MNCLQNNKQSNNFYITFIMKKVTVDDLVGASKNKQHYPVHIILYIQYTVHTVL